MRAADWVKEHSATRYAQDGEDGLLDAIFVAVGCTKGFCVDVGAWDGVRVSNTYNLIRRGWGGLLIEPDQRRFRSLVANMRPFHDVRCRRTAVSIAGSSSLDSLLEAEGVPRDFELLSIDVDGMDYHLWAALKSFAPKVVVIEYNPTIPNGVEFIQKPDPRVRHGSSIKSLCQLAARKGYELVAATAANAIFLRGDLFRSLGVEDNSVAALRDDGPMTTSLFQGIDGTLMIAGNRRLIWQDLPIDEKRIQVVPKLLRRHPDDLPGPLRLLRHAWILMYLTRTRDFRDQLRSKIRRRTRREAAAASDDGENDHRG